MINGITYFKLTSPYMGDVTKNCGLTGGEIDNNFYVLEGRDINDASLDGTVLDITLYNGDHKFVDLSPIFESAVRDLSFSFDGETGTLKIIQNGVETDITGFITDDSKSLYVRTNETLTGNGRTVALGVAKTHLTGQVRPVKKIWDKETMGELPETPTYGDRYLVKDKASSYGKLYNYAGVKCIACALTDASSQWRVPTKEDWDDMLNALEPNPEKRNHGRTTDDNVYLGQFAGAYLKSEEGWRESETTDGDETVDVTTCACGRPSTTCNPTYCGEYACCTMRCGGDTTPSEFEHIFNAVPTGYYDDGGICSYFGERTAFWTATMTSRGNSAFIKRLEWNGSRVYQAIWSAQNKLPLRLVKDYDGTNFYGYERILDGTYKTVLMPSSDGGMKVWLADNINVGAGSCCDCDGCQTYAEPCGEVEYTDRYYTVEWDGHRWLSLEFGKGDSVVVRDGEEGNTYDEYRLYEDGLKKVNDAIAEDIYGDLIERIDNLDERVSDLTDDVDELRNDLTDVTELVQNLSETVGDENGGLVKDVEDLKTANEGIDEKLGEIITDGEFDAETGILTLNKENGDSIGVQFSFNFGDI